MKTMTRSIGSGWLILLLSVGSAAAETTVDGDLARIGTTRGIVALVGLPADGAEYVINLAGASELMLYVQSADVQRVTALRTAADAAGLLGNRIFADPALVDRLCSQLIPGVRADTISIRQII